MLVSRIVLKLAPEAGDLGRGLQLVEIRLFGRNWQSQFVVVLAHVDLRETILPLLLLSQLLHLDTRLSFFLLLKSFFFKKFIEHLYLQ